MWKRTKAIKEDLFKLYISKANTKLYDYIAVVYGVTLSYGFYVLTKCFVEFFNYIKADYTFTSPDKTALYKFIIQSGLFLITTLYLVIDLGGMVKVTYNLEYAHHSRFIHDMIIALCFLFMYHEIKELSVVYLFAFSINLFVAGIWGNNLKQEVTFLKELEHLEKDVSKRFLNWGITIRNTHYVGASVMLILFGYSLIQNLIFFKQRYILEFNFILLIMLFVGFYLWYIYFLHYSIIYSRERDRELSVPIGLPAFLTLIIVKSALKRKEKIIERIKK